MVKYHSETYGDVSEWHLTVKNGYFELKKEPIPWKAVYLEDPLDIMDDKKPEPPPDFQSRVNLPEMNRRWIKNQEERGEERLEEIFRMNNVGSVL